jgi:hypothetical protein
VAVAAERLQPYALAVLAAVVVALLLEWMGQTPDQLIQVVAVAVAVLESVTTLLEKAVLVL